MLFLWFAFANSFVLAQEHSPQSAYSSSDIKQFNLLLKQSNSALTISNVAKARVKLLAAENILKTMKADNEPIWCAKLALLFAKVGLIEKAKLYQARATRTSRGPNTMAIETLNELAESYAILNDKDGLNAMFEKAILTSPQANKRQVQLAYVNGLFGVDGNVKASTILNELYTDQLLSNSERAEILSLLIINSLKLNQHQQLDQYYQELMAIPGIQSANSILAKGMYQLFKNRYTSALPYLRQLLAAFNSGKNQFVYVEGVLQLAHLNSLTLARDSADYYFAKAAATLRKPFESTAIGLHYLKLLNAHQIRFKISTSRATDAILSKDSVYQKELIAATKELAYKYKIEQDKQKTLLLQQQQALETLEFDKKKQRLLWISCSLGLLLLGGGIIIYLLYQRKKQNQLLHQAELERLKTMHKTEIIKKLSAAQEAERWRIADQLHDEVGSMLSVARLNLSSHPLKDTPIQPEKLEAASRILADVADTVREMSHQLMPVAIRQYGLINALEQLINDINTSGKIYIEHLIYGFEDLSKYPEDFQISLYRIIQELFQNIVKHSKATNAIFQLIEHPDSINLYIEDNGKGIDQEEEQKNGKGIGLLTNRIDYFEGKISIEGHPGKGTLIVIDIPTIHMGKI